MRHCQACETFGGKSGAHRAELEIVHYAQDLRLAVRVCLCCWYAIAFKQGSDRRRLECPGSTETHYICRIRDPSLLGTVYADALIRSLKTTMLYRLTHPEG